MKVGINPENLLEKSALALGQVPQPSIETQGSLLLARVLIVATQLGVFEALAANPLPVEALASQCHANPNALQRLLDALVGTDYLAVDEKNGYSLTAVSRKWLLKDSKVSLHDFIVSRDLVWELLTHLGDFIQTGESIPLYEQMTPDQWQLYHQGLRSVANLPGAEVVKSTPMPAKARQMLDIGGSHGYYSVALCRQYPNLQAVILELPAGIEAAKSILEQENMGDRVVYQAGDATKDDLGTNVYDLVFISNVIQDFDEKTNIDLFTRVAKSLRSGGYLVVQKTMFPAKDEGQLGGFFNLFLALTGSVDNWSFQQIAQWQKIAGLVPQKPIQFRLTPATGQQVAMKP